jgi:mannose-6-phosphate isomerase
MTQPTAVAARPYRMRNQIQHYAWGTRGADAYIPQLLGIEPEPDRPYAELWMGAHTSAPSEIELESGDWVPLDRWIGDYPETTIGAEVQARFGQLPFLFKVLSAGEALSIQAHPTKNQAEALHARDPEHYPDDNHKPEIAIALDTLIALVGFRPFPELVDALLRYPELARFAGVETSTRLLDAVDPDQKEQRALAYELFAALVQRAVDEPRALEDAIEEMAMRLTPREYLDERESRFLALRQQYGDGDVGLFVLFIFNLVCLDAGKGIFTDAGVPHAYLEGNIIECMANSDNVVRVGLTPKFRDAETLLRIVDVTPQAPDILGGSPEEVAKGVTRAHYTTPAPEFELHRWRLDEGAGHELQKDASPAILLVIQGQVELTWDDGAESSLLRRGESAFLPACLSAWRIRAARAAEVVQAGMPETRR